MSTNDLIPFATLVLRMSDISLSDTLANYPLTNDTGTINQNRTEYTFYNVNLKTIIGNDIYEKYDYFNIRISGLIATGSIVPLMLGGTLDGTSYLCLKVFLSGLNFINNTYDTRTQTNSGSCCINYYTCNTSGGATVPYQATTFDESYIYTIKKTECVNLTFKYLTMDNKSPDIYIDPAGTNAQKLFPRVTWIIDFIPIPTF